VIHRDVARGHGRHEQRPVQVVYAITDLPAEEANAAEIASWARGLQ